jgi:outer membrane protein TolC
VLDPSSAEARDPGVRVAAALREQQHAATRVAEAELLPELSLSAGLSGRAGGADSTSGARPDGNGWLPDVPNWDVGILLTWPLYDASSRARTSASRARELERAAEVDAARLRLSSAVLQAAQSFKVATDSLPALERAAAAAAANQAQGEARFRAGLGSSVELADAEALRLQGEIDLAVGKFEQARSRARLSRALAEGL